MVVISRRSTFTDHASAMMWCMVAVRTCWSAAMRHREIRSSGPYDSGAEEVPRRGIAGARAAGRVCEKVMEDRGRAYVGRIFRCGPANVLGSKRPGLYAWRGPAGRPVERR